MKFELRVYDATKEEIAAIIGGNPIGLAGLAGSTALVHSGGNVTGATSTVPMPQNGGNDDDNGPANTNAPAVDAAGLPWDDRIHSKNKGMNTDGTWRKKRNVDLALVTSVETELRARPIMQQPVMQQQPIMQQQQMPQGQMQQPIMQQQPAPMMPGPNFVPPMPDQQQQQQPIMQQPAPMDFNAFMTHLAGQMAKRDVNGAPLINTDYLANVAQRLSQHFQRQFNSITDIAGDANVIATAVNLITLDRRWD